MRACVLALLLALLLPAHAGLLGRLLHRERLPLMVGYFGQWGLYNDPPNYLRELVENGAAGRLDQINYAQGSVKGGRCSIADPKADLQTTYTAANSVSGKPDNPASPFRGYFHQLTQLKRKYPKLKVLISLEGSAVSFAEDATPENRRAFVASCVDLFLRGHFAPGIHEPRLFDGIDVDWEYPQQQDAENFRALLEEFRRQMDAVRPGLRLAIAVGDDPHSAAGTDFHVISRIVDQVGVMNYDYAGPWNKKTGLLAPLFHRPNSAGFSGSIALSTAGYEAAGVPREKLLMGLPFYGYRWTGVHSENNGLFQPGHGVSEDKPYRYIQNLSSSYSVFRDPKSRAPWLFDGDNFWTFEDPISIGYKASYAAKQHLGGVMIWELGQDTEDATLLNVAWDALRHPVDILMVEQELQPGPVANLEPALSR